MNDPAEVERLVADHLHLAKQAATRLRGGEWAERYADGLEGLLDAARRYDPEHAKGAKFSTYAWNRICGQIVDGQRRLDYVPRLLRKAGGYFTPHSLDALIADTDGLAFTETLRCDWAEAAFDAVDDADEHAWRMRLVRRAIELLPKQARTVIEQRLAGRKMLEIGVDIGVSEARVSQIHKAAVELLREILAPSPAAAPA